MRLYNGTDWIEVQLTNPEAYQEIKTIWREHIPHTDKSSTTDLGRERETTLKINALTEEKREKILTFLDNLDAISNDGGITYYKAEYLGGDEITFFNTTWHIIRADLLLSAYKYSFAETEKTGDLALPNAGNARAIPTFEITGEATTDPITISDGVRTLTITKGILVTDILKVSDYQLLLNSVEITEFLSGDYPQIPEEQTDFTLTITGITDSKVTVKYRSTWR